MTLRSDAVMPRRAAPRANAARRFGGVLVLLLAIVAPGNNVSAASTSLYRIFLLDGTTLTSYGEFARVADRVVFSIPIGSLVPQPALQLISIAQSSVDWERTDKYAEAVRAKRYAETRGEEDFALLSSRVVEALNQLALTPDPARRLAMAEEARRNLAQWPAQNFGYRAGDVAQLSGMLDEVVSELRVAAGQSSFDLSLVANVAAPALVDLLPDPDVRETTEQALAAARVTPEPAERISLLRAIVDSLAEPSSIGGWAADLRGRASSELASELRTSQAYADLSSSTIAAAKTRAKRGDVKGLQGIILSALSADDRLGHRRSGEMAALLTFLDMRLDEARQIRLAMDQWEWRRTLFAAYRKKLSPVIQDFQGVKGWLTDIRQLAGPPPRLLDALDRRLTIVSLSLSALTAPAELEPVQSTMGSAIQMARRAAAIRRNAVSSRDMKLAWDASSAAAGALMLVDHALAELDR
ncbi:MAG TPA: hypothetical protein VF147_14265, partial [Vicinamibacterales bacterium]